MNDYIEIFTTGTDPVDADTDDDFLNDGIEINVNNTDPFDNDTDDDGLTDGLEVLNYFTNPLVADSDADVDGYYWFQDCNDSNPMIYPTQLSILNPSWFKPSTRSLFATLDLGIIKLILRPMFLSIYSISSEESLALAHIDTVTPRKKQALAVPSPIASHCIRFRSLFSLETSIAHFAANGDVNTK